MRRLILISFVVISVAGLVWWWQRPRQFPIEPVTKKIVTATNFSLLTSPAFSANAAIPEKYTCDGENISPPFSIIRVPPAVKYFAMIMEDQDAPNGGYDHWVVWDLPGNTRDIPEDVQAGVLGRSSHRKNEYTGPCPSGDKHTYRWQVFGYTQTLNLPTGATKKELLKALDGRAIVSAELVGTYQRP